MDTIKAKIEIEQWLREMYSLKHKREVKIVGAGLRTQQLGLRQRLVELETAIAELVVDEDIERAELESAIANQAMLIGESVESSWGKVEYTSGYPRITYNAKALDAISSADEKKHEWLFPLRKQVLVRARAKVTIYEEGGE